MKIPSTLTGTVDANTSPSNTVGWMSTPRVGVVANFVRHSSVPVFWSSASTPFDPASATTRPSATATPKGPTLNPLPALVQRVLPVSASIATTTPEPPWTYTVPPTTTAAVDNVAAPGTSAANASCSRSTFALVIRLPIAARELS